MRTKAILAAIGAAVVSILAVMGIRRYRNGDSTEVQTVED